MALLLGSVLANLVQIIAFFLSKPYDPHASTRRAARDSFDAFVGPVLSLRSSPPQPHAPRASIAELSREMVMAAAVTHARSTVHARPPPHPNETGEQRALAVSSFVSTLPSFARHPAALHRDLSDTHAAAATPARHPQYRIAFTVPWIGSTFPSWFPYFLSSCRRSAFLADWLIFHEDALVPGLDDVPPNVIFHNLGRGGLGLLFGSRIALALGVRGATSRLVELFQIAFREFAYIVTEYKPTHGAVFAEYLKPYSHWSYTDIDMLIGDLPMHIELEELAQYDIFTYHFGDVFRLYLRGQFAAHRNSPQINLLWAECPHLGVGLVQELEAKHDIAQRLVKEGKNGRTRFISAEGCYSWVIASTPGMRLKFASKAFADWSDHREFYVVAGAVRKCSQPSQVWKPDTAPSPLPATARKTSHCNPFGMRVAQHSTLLPGVQRPMGAPRRIDIHADCSRWVEQRYRLCADLTEEEAPLYNVILTNSSWSATRFVNHEPAGSLEGAFLHLQRWKAEYKRLTYGAEGMPPLNRHHLFKLSRLGFGVYDMDFDDHLGANFSQLPGSRQGSLHSHPPPEATNQSPFFRGSSLGI